MHMIFFRGGNAFLGTLGGREVRKGAVLFFCLFCFQKIVVKMCSSISDFLLIQPVALGLFEVFQIFCLT